MRTKANARALFIVKVSPGKICKPWFQANHGQRSKCTALNSRVSVEKGCSRHTCLTSSKGRMNWAFGHRSPVGHGLLQSVVLGVHFCTTDCGLSRKITKCSGVVRLSKNMRIRQETEHSTWSAFIFTRIIKTHRKTKNPYLLLALRSTWDGYSKTHFNVDLIPADMKYTAFPFLVMCFGRAVLCVAWIFRYCLIARQLAPIKITSWRCGIESWIAGIGWRPICQTITCGFLM